MFQLSQKTAKALESPTGAGLRAAMAAGRKPAGAEAPAAAAADQNPDRATAAEDTTTATGGAARGVVAVAADRFGK